MQIFGLFPGIESHSSRGVYPRRIGGAEYSGTVLDILSLQYSPQLHAIGAGAWPFLAPLNLLKWLSARSAPGGSCSRLNKVVLSEQPLPSKMTSASAANSTDPYGGRFMMPRMWHYCLPLSGYLTDFPFLIIMFETGRETRGRRDRGFERLPDSFAVGRRRGVNEERGES
jgi:hypothetical protein